MINITVLTPTYNRAERLKKLYESLCNQTCRDFEWVVIDDGSTDDTSSVVGQMKAESGCRFSVRYFKKENGGKHTALNFAYKYIDSLLTLIVDSDDTLTSDAIATVKETYLRYKDEKDLCGFSFLRGKPDGGFLSTSGVPQDGMKETFVECRIKRGIEGDMAEVWYTHCLKEYPFPIFEGEKFLGEDIVWIKMAERYKMRFFNRVIYISDYMEDGLTKNRRKHNIMAPNGCVARAEVFLDADIPAKSRIKAALQYQVYGRFALKRTQELFSQTRKKYLFIVFFLPARVLYSSWKRNVRFK